MTSSIFNVFPLVTIDEQEFFTLGNSNTKGRGASQCERLALCVRLKLEKLGGFGGITTTIGRGVGTTCVSQQLLQNILSKNNRTL